MKIERTYYMNLCLSKNESFVTQFLAIFFWFQWKSNASQRNWPQVAVLSHPAFVWESQRTSGLHLWMPDSVLLLTRSPWRHLKTWGQAAVLCNWTFVLKLPLSTKCWMVSWKCWDRVWTPCLAWLWLTHGQQLSGPGQVCFKSVCWKKCVSLACICLTALREKDESFEVGVSCRRVSPFFFF